MTSRGDVRRSGGGEELREALLELLDLGGGTPLTIEGYRLGEVGRRRVLMFHRRAQVKLGAASS